MTDRMKQTRIKITWFGAITFALIALLGVVHAFFSEGGGMEQVIITAIGGITFIIGGYQASEGWTKGKYIDKIQKEEK